MKNIIISVITLSSILTSLSAQACAALGFDKSATSPVVVKVTNLKGVTTSYSYDGLGRVIQIKHQHSFTLLAQYDYVLNPSGNATQMTITTSQGIIRTEQYTYDTVNRVTQAVYINSSLNNKNTTTVNYTYDGNGNRLSMSTQSNGTATVKTYTYGNDNRLINVTDGTGALIAQHAYDGAGNRIQKITPSGTIYYTYDERNCSPVSSAQRIMSSTYMMEQFSELPKLRMVY